MSREMKDSGIEWIGELPEGWRKIRIKDFFEFQKGINAAIYTNEYIGANKGEYPVYSGQTENDGIMGKINSYDYNLTECLFTTTVGANVMTLKVLNGKFNLSQNCLIMTKKKDIDINFVYFFMNILFNYEKSLIPNYMQPSLRINDLLRYSIFIPALIKQKTISKYLKEQISNIDNVINLTKESINKYKEYKKSLIYETVTKGLDKNVELKDGGIEWIGEIPENWDISIIKREAIEIMSGVWGSEPKHDNDDVMCIRIADFDRDKNKLKHYDFIKRNINNEDFKKHKVFKYDILIEKSGGGENQPVGYPVLYDNDIEAVFTNFMTKIKFDLNKNNPIFFNYLLSSLYNSGYIWRLIKQTTGLQNLDNNAYFTEKIVKPPLKEQKEIAEYLDKKTKEIDEIILKKEQYIKKLEEYKKSLIFEVVTGKKEI